MKDEMKEEMNDEGWVMHRWRDVMKDEEGGVPPSADFAPGSTGVRRKASAPTVRNNASCAPVGADDHLIRDGSQGCAFIAGSGLSSDAPSVLRAALSGS